MARPAALVAVLAVVIGLGAAAWFVLFAPQSGDRFAACRETVVATAGGGLGAPFSLVNKDGVRMSYEEIVDKPALLYFGYTYCPDVCPVDTARNVDAVDILAERGVTLKPIFVTIDPARDDPQTVGEFAANLHPTMLGLTGPDAEIAKVLKDWRVYRNKVGDDPEDYLMDHSTTTYLVAPGHGMLEVFRRSHTPEEIAERAACFIDRL